MKEFDKNLDKDIIAFMNSYKIIDDQEIYSNKIEFVPIFRVVQWLAYNKPFEEIERLNNIIDKLEKAILNTYPCMNMYEQDFKSELLNILKDLKGEN